MDHRPRGLVIKVEPATDNNYPKVRDLWLDSGEHNVDVRGSAEALESGALQVFKVGEDIIATGGFYAYAKGRFTELGSSCWLEAYRGLGGADVSVCFRAVLASLYEPGTLITTEHYETSTKSARVLLRNGFEELSLIPLEMHEHALSANASQRVRHLALSPWRVPRCARQLLRWINGEPATESPIGPVFEFSRAYGFDNPAFRAAIERLAGGDTEVIGHYGDPPLTLEQWVSEKATSPILTQESFLTLLHRPH
ncbi:MAG: hypothetical protein E6G92_00210 [Alphaproteobacteria bacterium]|nr:MAG: hypothetical protein E6G92_00210 [Alphaproteobacteria bacterium]